MSRRNQPQVIVQRRSTFRHNNALLIAANLFSAIVSGLAIRIIFFNGFFAKNFGEMVWGGVDIWNLTDWILALLAGAVIFLYAFPVERHHLNPDALWDIKNVPGMWQRTFALMFVHVMVVFAVSTTTSVVFSGGDVASESAMEDAVFEMGNRVDDLSIASNLEQSLLENMVAFKPHMEDSRLRALAGDKTDVAGRGVLARTYEEIVKNITIFQDSAKVKRLKSSEVFLGCEDLISEMREIVNSDSLSALSKRQSLAPKIRLLNANFARIQTLSISADYARLAKLLPRLVSESNGGFARDSVTVLRQRANLLRIKADMEIKSEEMLQEVSDAGAVEMSKVHFRESQYHPMVAIFSHWWSIKLHWAFMTLVDLVGPLLFLFAFVNTPRYQEEEESEEVALT
jgi:hypothetical protein